MTFIERLEFGEGTRFSALESSIHLNRYMQARGLCKDKKVLDIACGEGYGSFVMADAWHAQEVIGVDISKETIGKAEQLFKRRNLKFMCADAMKDEELFEPKSFDLIISLETIEHLIHPEKFLSNLKRWIKDDGVIIVSCPNDNWYYSTPEAKNPFHERKYTLPEFTEMCEGVLGKARGHLLGMPASGYTNLPVTSSLLNKQKEDMSSMFDFQNKETIMLPSAHEINASNVSYFIGVWGPDEMALDSTSCIFATSMDESRVVSYSEYLVVRDRESELLSRIYELDGKIATLNNKLNEIEEENKRLQAQNKKLSLSVKGTIKENEYLRHNIWLVEQQSVTPTAIKSRIKERLKRWPFMAPAIKVYKKLKHRR